MKPTANPAPLSEPPSPQAILNMAQGFQASRVLLTGLELGVFTTVRKRAQIGRRTYTSKDVAKEEQ